MKRLSLLFVGLSLLLAPAAHALPFIDMGAKVGMGKTLYSTDNDMLQKSLDDLENKVLALGVAARIQVAVIQLEANALYWGETIDGKATYDALSLPLIARFDFAPVPLLKLAAGTGLEFRFPLSATDTSGEDSLKTFQKNTYVPLSLSADLSIPVIGITAGVEARYGYELGSRVKDSPVAIDSSYFLLLATFLF